MRAVLHTAYGPADLLRVIDVDKPVPKPRQVLIKIRATTVSTGDCNIRNLTFVPHSMAPMAKLMFGVGKPWRKRVLGTQLAGEVEAVGQNVRRFQVGDKIFGSTGMAGGGHAQYACLPEDGSLAILDTVAATTFARCKQSLRPEGVFLSCIMSPTDMLFRMPWTALTRGKRLKGGVAIETQDRMNTITEFAAAGILRPVVDRSYPLEQIAEAFTYVERGHKKGNVVITVAHPEEEGMRRDQHDR